MKKVSIKTHEDDVWEYGKTYIDDEFITDWMRLKKELWVSKKPIEYLADFHIFVNEKTAETIENIVDGNINLLYWMWGITHTNDRYSDIFVKLLLGPLSRESKNRNISIKDVIHPITIKRYIEAVDQDLIDKSKSKEFFEELLTRISFDDLMNSDKFKPIDHGSMSVFVDEVINNNPDQVQKAKQNPQLINWLVGQVMKNSKGKASADVVKQLINKKLEEY